MKKAFLLLSIIICFLSLSSCRDYTTFPDMVEYTQEEILAIAKDKYQIESFLFTENEFHGDVNVDTNGNLQINSYGDFNDNFLNGNNISAALTAFAGKNGDSTIQKQYKNFLCYVALGLNTDGEAKFIYYNTNIHKDAVQIDTIGMSDYPFEILPNEINKETFSSLSAWGDMHTYMNKRFASKANYDYSKNRLTAYYVDKYESRIELSYYIENEELTYDLFYLKKDQAPLLVYSSSERYGVIYKRSEADIQTYVDTQYTVMQSTDQTNCEVLYGTATIKEIFSGTLLYSEISVRAYYKVLIEGVVLNRTVIQRYFDTNEVTIEIEMDKIKGINHHTTASIAVGDFYIFYEKSS